MNSGQRILASFAAVTAMGFGLFTAAARAQQEPAPEQEPAPIVIPQILTEKFNVLAHACTADNFRVGANATIAVSAAAAAQTGKMSMNIDAEGRASFKLALTDEERAALQRGLDNLWAAAAAELTASTDLPNPAPQDFDYARLRAALTNNIPTFQIKASEDIGIPVGISGFNYKIPQPGCLAPDVKP